MKIRSPGITGPLIVLGLTVLGAAPSMVAAASPSPAGPPAPVCGDGVPPSWMTNAKDPNDDVPDPAGRIVFGDFLTKDPTYGPLTTLYAIDPDGSDLAMLTDCQVEWPHISPDGTRVALSIRMDDGSMQVATTAIDGSDLRILTTTGYNEYPDWSPDGTWLVYSHVQDADVEAINRECPLNDCLVTLGIKEPLWRMNADGSDQRLLGDPAMVDFWPRLSPDGTKVTFIRVDPPNHDWFTIMIRDLTTGEEHQVTANDREPTLPAWSHDGRSILYTTSHQAGSTDIWNQIETVAANDPTAVPTVVRSVAEGGGGSQPSYSPDGSRIVFFGCDGRLCTMAADGSDVQKLFSPPEGVVPVQPNWGIVPPPAP
jgi:Tol biopolymer transport system component